MHSRRNGVKEAVSVYINDSAQVRSLRIQANLDLGVGARRCAITTLATVRDIGPRIVLPHLHTPTGERPVPVSY